jgi:hypothetical protein
MPVIQVNEKQHALKPGQTRLGAGPGVDVSVSGNAELGLQAILELGADNQVVIRRARDGASVRVNGVALGVEPTPLMHGDKVDVAGTEILFSEDKKVGATQFVSASDVAAIAAKRSGPARATASTGGRLVSLVDGKEYQIPAAGVVFGREAGSDVVVAQPEVSRRHASIAPGDSGYVLQDLSTNGVWVNGNRVQGSQLLARSDVVRVGSEEFRFYADVAPAPKGTPGSSPVTGPSAPTPVASPVQPSAPAPRAEPITKPEPISEPPVAMRPAAQSPVAAAPKPSPVASARVEPPTVPASMGPPSRVAAPEPVPEPAAAHAPARPAPPPRPAPAVKAKREGPSVTVVEKKGGGGVPVWVWFLIIAVVAVGAYFAGKGIG